VNRASKWVVLAAVVLTLLVGVSVASAQYGASNRLQQLVNAERASTTTVQIECSVNNVRSNILNEGKSPSGEEDRNGYNILELGADQKALPVVCALPAGEFTEITLSFEGTDYEWAVKVDPNGLFLTNFPTNSFPPGEYYLTINGVRILRVIVPE